MTRKEKISKAKQLLTGEQVRDPKAFIVIIEEGVERCNDPGYPAEVMPQDIVFHITVLSDLEVKKRFESRNPNKDNGNIAGSINN